MNRLEVGENIVLSELADRFSFIFQDPSNTVAITNTKYQFSFSTNQNDLSLSDFDRQQIESVEILVYSTSAKDYQLEIKDVCFGVVPLSNGWTKVGRIYKYNGSQWRFRLMMANYNTANDVQNELGVKPTLNRPSVSNNIAPVAQQPSYVPAPSLATTRPSMNMVLNNPHSIVALDVTKMQTVTLPELRNMYIGFGWKSLSDKTGILQKLVTTQSVTINMDLVLMLYDRNGNYLDTISANNPRSRDLAIYHYGDKSESNDGDSEMVSVSLAGLDPNIRFISIVISSNKGHKFNLLESSKLRVKNQEGMIPIFQYDLENNEDKHSCILGLFSRDNSEVWQYQAIESYERKDLTQLRQLVENWVRFIGKFRNIL